MTKATFEVELKHQVGLVGPRSRPFLCDGHPLAAEVFIVGFNSATSLSRPFLDFWDAKDGMNLQSFDGFYCALRTTLKTKTGRFKRPFSRTRERVNEIAEDASSGNSSPRVAKYWGYSRIPAVPKRHPSVFMACYQRLLVSERNSTRPTKSLEDHSLFSVVVTSMQTKVYHSSRKPSEGSGGSFGESLGQQHNGNKLQTSFKNFGR
jgi:hypothetical protein